MITGREVYKEYMRYESDIYAQGGVKRVIYNVLTPPAYAFLKSLRRLEYHYNTPGIYHKLMLPYVYWRYLKFSQKAGISISKNSCAKGLTLYHFGSIVINAAAKIGRNCCVMNNVNIGANAGSEKAPKIGDNVYIGPGAVIYGEIEIADGCYIGANAVVNKTFAEPGSVIAGAPAKVIKKDHENWWQKNKMNREL